jgi:hypothetical protein
VPPNLDPAIAKQVIEYLKANPEAAQQSYEQAHRMLHTPGMAQMMLDAKVSVHACCAVSTWGHQHDVPPACTQRTSAQNSPEHMAKMMQLKDDAELKPVFDDIEAHGAAAMEKYWNDTELMSRISQKLAAMNIGPATPPRPQDLPKYKVGA